MPDLKGRPSLSRSGVSRQLRTRVCQETAVQAENYAAAHDTTVSALLRDLLERELHPTRREVLVQRELHRSLLARFTENPTRVREIALGNLDRMAARARSPQARGWLDEWRELLTGPSEELIATLLDDTDHATDLRQVSPFVGVLSEEQRLAAITRAVQERPHAAQ